MQNRHPNQPRDWIYHPLSYLQSFFSGTSTSSSSSTTAIAAAAAAASSSSSASAAAAIVRSPVAARPTGDFASSPTDVIRNVLAPMLDSRSLGRLDRTCRGMNAVLSSFPGPLLLQKLAHYLVVEPNPAKVIQMIRANPQLLQSKIKEVIVNGVSIRGYTPFQLAYGACDVNAKVGEDGMCEALEEELARHLGSKEAAIAEIQRQIKEKKFNVIDQEKDTEIKNKLAVALGNVIQAISNERFDRGHDANKLILNPATLTAIATFRTALAELQPKVIEEGMHFRSNTLQETLDAYVQAAASWRYDYNKCVLFADGALSSVLLSCVPVNDKQRFSQGLYYLYEQDRKECFKRHLTLPNTNVNFDDCLRSASLDFSGLSGSCIHIYARGGECRLRLRGASSDVIFRNLYRTKTANLQNLCSRVDQRLRPGQ